MKPFHDLTHRGQGRRLRPHAVRALAAFGVRPVRLRQLTAATNVVFRVDAADARRLVLRMTAPKSAHSIENARAEIAWLRALHAVPAIGVPAPVPAKDGEFVHPLNAPDLPGTWHCTLYGWLPGVMLSERLTPPNLTRHGALAARLHSHGERFVPPDGSGIRTYDSPFPYSDPSFPNPEPIVLFDRCPYDLMPPDRVAVFRAACDRVRAAIDHLFDTRTPHVIHNDLHLWNVLVTRDRVYALDFEDLLLGHPIQDLATTLYYYRYRDDGAALLSAFRDGYVAVRPWPEERDGQLETLIVGRNILLANFVAASQDAADRTFAPEYLARTERRLRQFLAAPV